MSILTLFKNHGGTSYHIRTKVVFINLFERECVGGGLSVKGPARCSVPEPNAARSQNAPASHHQSHRPPARRQQQK